MQKRRIIHIHSLKFAIVEVIVICVSLFSMVIFLGDISINNDRTETNAKNSAIDIGNQIYHQCLILLHILKLNL